MLVQRSLCKFKGHCGLRQGEPGILGHARILAFDMRSVHVALNVQVHIQCAGMIRKYSPTLLICDRTDIFMFPPLQKANIRLHHDVMHVHVHVHNTVQCTCIIHSRTKRSIQCHAQYMF